MPYPPDYGGVTDVYYRIKALYEMGVNIHLHCFEYGRGKQPELNKYCIEVNYYKRSTGLKGVSFRLPYIVRSRANKKLLQNLLKDDHPVLLEGVHCTYFLFTGELKAKKVFVRLHNVEYEYYRQLAENETSLLKKLYYTIESSLLKKYEKKIANKAMLLPVSKKDAGIYQNVFAATRIRYLPAFSPCLLVNAKPGKGDYCLYHGNLSVAENEKAAIWLCENVFSQLLIPFMISGKKPGKKLQDVVKQNNNISLVSDPSEVRMNELISNAQVNILPSFNTTGIKIKLLNTLFTGRHCIVNKQAIDGTGLEPLCHIAETEEQYIDGVLRLFNEPFSLLEIEKRKELLKEFDNTANGGLLMQLIY